MNIELGLLAVASVCLLLGLAYWVIARPRAAPRSLRPTPVSQPEEGGEGFGPDAYRNGSSNGHGAWERRLRAAGLRGSPAGYLSLAILISGLAALTVGFLVPFTILPALLGGLVCFGILWEVLVWRGRRRAFRFEEQLVDALDLMVAGLTGGQTAEQALASAGEASEEPLRSEFRELLDRLNLGLSPVRALGRMIEFFDSEGVRLFGQTLEVKWEAGGDLARVLRAVADILRERVRQRRELRSQLAGAQWSSIFVAFFPYLVLPVFAALRPHWISSVFQDPLGLQLFFGAVVLQLLGFLWIRRLVRIEL